MFIDIHTHPPVDKLNPAELQKVFESGLYNKSSCLCFLNIIPGMFVEDVQLPVQIRLSTGIHPWRARDEVNPEKLRAVFSADAISLIGEIGLDKKAVVDFKLQLEVFECQLKLAAAYHKPVLIHTVGSMSEMLALKEKYSEIPAWIIHGFRGKAIQAAQWINHGCYLSFGMNYNAEALQSCPADKLFLETDVSGISIEQVYNRAARTRVCSVAALENQLEKNMFGLFMQ